MTRDPRDDPRYDPRFVNPRYRIHNLDGLAAQNIRRERMEELDNLRASHELAAAVAAWRKYRAEREAKHSKDEPIQQEPTHQERAEDDSPKRLGDFDWSRWQIR